jgi:hypothetical protein
MADNPLKCLLVQTSSHYSVASLLTTVSGLVSFPLLARIFSVADYGVKNLISATLGVSALGKVGFQHTQSPLPGRDPLRQVAVHRAALLRDDAPRNDGERPRRHADPGRRRAPEPGAQHGRLS